MNGAREAATAWLTWLVHEQKLSRTHVKRITGLSTAHAARVLGGLHLSDRAWGRVIDAHFAWSTHAALHLVEGRSTGLTAPTWTPADRPPAATEIVGEGQEKMRQSHPVAYLSCRETDPGAEPFGALWVVDWGDPDLEPGWCTAEGFPFDACPGDRWTPLPAVASGAST